MADFKTPNLCGANEALNNASSKINDIKSEIESKLDSAASEAAAAFSTAQADVKAGLDALAQDLPETPNVNFQSEITSLINNIDRTTVEGLSAYNAKVAQLQADFGEVLKEKGLELDKLISESSTRLGKDVSTTTTAIGDAIGDITGGIGDAISSVTDAVGGAVSSVTDAVGGATSTGGTRDICDLIPNLEIPADISGTGKTIQEIEERSSTSTLTLTQTPKEIISVQGKKSDQSFFTNIQYTQNGKVIVPKQTGIYDTIKVVFTVSLIKEKPIAAKQADVPPEKEEVSIVTPNISSVEKKTEFKFSSLIKKLDNVSLGSVDSTKVNSDISSALSAIKSPELKTKMQADLDYAAAERKKLFADPLNYKQVVVPAESIGQKSRVVKVTTPEVQNTVKTETVTKPNPVTKKVETVTVKKTEKSTISINGIAMRKVMIKEKFVTSERADKGWPLVSDMSKLTLKHIPYQIDRVTARPYLKPNSEGITGVKKGVGYYSYTNPQIYGDRSSNDDEKVIVDGTKNITLEPVNKVKQQTVLKIKYIILEKLDPNFKG